MAADAAAAAATAAATAAAIAATIAATIAALEAQRALLGDVVVDTALAPLRAQWAALQAPPAQSLRQVTVLFMDVVGSTTLAQHLDPEDIHAIMDSALQAFTALVEQRHGRVLQYAGDSLLAAFGAETSREDDPALAIEAGLAILREARVHAATVLQQHGHRGFDVRVGVHTGSVLLGGGVDDEGSIRGMTVNMAARMEQTAPPGALRISQDTWRQVRGLFDVTEQPPLQVKGRDAPIQTYLVDRARPRAFQAGTRGVERVHTPMVGRDAELARLQAGWQDVERQGTRHAVCIVAEAGLGKSRLLAEFEAWLQAGTAAPAQSQSQSQLHPGPLPVRVWRARAQPQSEQQPYGLLRDLLAAALGINDSDTSDVARDKFVRGIVPLFEAEEGTAMAEAQAHVLGHLVGIDFSASVHVSGILEDARQRRNRAFHTATQWLRRSALQGAGMLLLEDLHWADDGSLDFLAQLHKGLDGVPIMVLAVARPSLFERRPGFDAAFERIDLLPLPASTGEQLADRLLAPLGVVPPALRDLIAGRAEGNPFYMEELVKMLIDDGAIAVIAADADDAAPAAADEAPRWRLVPERLIGTQVPGTLTGVLQARLDGLPVREKAALQEASVIGMIFWDAALAALDAEAPPLLPALDRRALVHPRAAGEYGFDHQILHQVTYDSLLKRARRACHARAGAWLAALDSARANDYLAAAARHFELAGENARAADHYLRAAERALPLFAHATAIDCAGSALALAAAGDHTTRWRALLVRQRSLRLQGALAAQGADLDAMQTLADAAGRDDWRALVLLRRAAAHEAAGDLHAAEATARQALDLALAVGADAVAASAFVARAGALRVLGRHADAHAVAGAGLVFARRHHNRRAEGELLTGLAAVATERGDLVDAVRLYADSLRSDREIGACNSECATLINLGDCQARLGDAAAAGRVLDEALALCRAIGLRGLEAGALLNLSAVAQQAGEMATAAGLARQALALSQAIGNREYEAYAWMALGHAELGRIDPGVGVAVVAGVAGIAVATAAQAAYRCAHELLIGLGMPHLAVEADAGLALCARALGDLPLAMGHVEAVLAQLAAQGHLDGTERPLRIRLACFEVLADAGDTRAQPVLAAAHAALQTLAAALPDSTAQERLLTQIPWHRALVAAWARR